MIQPHLRQRDLSVVATIVDIHDFQLGLQQFDRGQDAIPMQAVRVQVVRLEIRGRDDADPIFEEGLEQPVQDHRVGHVSHMKFIKTNQAVAARHALAQFLQRVHDALQLGQFPMHLAHEFMKMQARLAL